MKVYQQPDSISIHIFDKRFVKILCKNSNAPRRGSGIPRRGALRFYGVIQGKWRSLLYRWVSGRPQKASTGETPLKGLRPISLSKAASIMGRWQL